jgi:flagellar biosynthesis protein FlhB
MFVFLWIATTILSPVDPCKYLLCTEAFGSKLQRLNFTNTISGRQYSVQGALQLVRSLHAQLYTVLRLCECSNCTGSARQSSSSW